MKICKNGHPIGTIDDCIACRRSRIAKKRWENPSQAMLKTCETARKYSNTNGLKSTVAKAKRAAYFSSDIHKQRARNQALKLAEERRSGERPPTPSKISNTKPELAVKRTLDNLGLQYIQQYPIGPYLFDFAIPSHKILIEVQGEYWHSLQNNIANDLSKESYVRSQHPDHKIFYISELDTLKIGQINKLLAKATSSMIIQKKISIHAINIEDIDQKIASQFLAQYHYLPRFRKTMRFVHGIFHDKELIGVIIYSIPSYNTISSKYRIKSNQILELSRLVLADNCHTKNVLSRSLSKSIKLIKSSSLDIRLIVSFADPHFGHNGGVYKACNWVEDGQTSPSYYYVDDHLNILHKKTVWDHAKKFKLRESDYANSNNLIRISTPGKKKFIYWLSKPKTFTDVNHLAMVTAVCDCGNEKSITQTSLDKTIKKHGRYICLTCSIKENWKNGIYTNRPKRISINRSERIEVKCECGKEKTITRKSVDSAIRKHGRYICMGCIKKQQHSDGIYRQ